MRLIKPFATLAIMTLLLSVAFALAPAKPGIDVSVDPESLEIQGGGSGTLTVSVASLEGFEGAVDLGVLLKPAGMTESWSEDPVQVPPFSEIETTLTLSVAAGTPAGEVEVKISGSAPQISSPQVSVMVTILASAGGEEPPANGEEPPANGEEPPANGEEPPANGEEPPVGEDRTITMTTTFTTTENLITTETETMIITTRTSDIIINTSTTFEQAYDVIYPAATILAVIALLAVAVLALRGR